MGSDWYICRHGETDHNVRQLVQGHTDIPLNENGRAQAREAARKLQEKGLLFDHVLSSPLSRALETAVTLSGFEEKDVEILPILKEMGFGVLENKPYIGYSEEMNVLNYDPVSYRAPEGGEELRDMFDRMAQFLRELKESGREGNILISTHGMTIRGICSVIRGTGPEKIWEMKVGNCDVLHFRPEGDRIVELPPVLSYEEKFDPEMKYEEQDYKEQTAILD